MIIVIDEAQTLNTDVLETIRLLSNFETASDKLLQIIFSGQPQLAEKLASPELAKLRQRISIFTTLTPFDRPDTEKYIEHRLRLAGYRGRRLFTPEAITTVWMYSQGIPRNVNALCFNALLLAGSEGRQQIDEGAVLEVVKDRDLDLLALPAAGGQPNSGRPRIERLKTPILAATRSREHLTGSLCKLHPSAGSSKLSRPTIHHDKHGRVEPAGYASANQPRGASADSCEWGSHRHTAQ